MATNPQYGGSELFAWAADYLSISVDQVNFVISQFVALGLASCFRTILHPSKTSTAARHGFGLMGGLVIGYFCFGTQAVHLATLPALCYIVMRTQNPEIMQRMVLAVALTYLSCLHLHRQFYEPDSYYLDITGPLMVIVQKVTSLAFSIHDGLAREESELTTSQKQNAIKVFPTPLEYFSYMLMFPTIMAGPVLFYNDYMAFITGENYSIYESVNTPQYSRVRMVIRDPAPTVHVVKKVILSVICAVIFIKFLPSYPLDELKDDYFVERTSLTYKFWYLSMLTTLVRFKYYFAWSFADAICNNAGIGFNGYNELGFERWDKFSNIDILKFELGRNLRESIEAWNMGTNRWLRMIVYERVNKYATVLTYALSAVWHGFYPGYYLTFASGALFTFGARTVRRHLRGNFTGNSEMKIFYDIMTLMTTRLVMAYITFPFILLEFGASMRIYYNMYYCLHIFAFLAIFSVPQLFPKVIAMENTPSSRSNKSGATNGLTSVLRQASPIANSVSNHHD